MLHLDPQKKEEQPSFSEDTIKEYLAHIPQVREFNFYSCSDLFYIIAEKLNLDGGLAYQAAEWLIEHKQDLNYVVTSDVWGQGLSTLTKAVGEFSLRLADQYRERHERANRINSLQNPKSDASESKKSTEETQSLLFIDKKLQEQHSRDITEKETRAIQLIEKMLQHGADANLGNISPAELIFKSFVVSVYEDHDPDIDFQYRIKILTLLANYGLNFKAGNIIKKAIESRDLKAIDFIVQQGAEIKEKGFTWFYDAIKARHLPTTLYFYGLIQPNETLLEKALELAIEELVYAVKIENPHRCEESVAIILFLVEKGASQNQLQSPNFLFSLAYRKNPKKTSETLQKIYQLIDFTKLSKADLLAQCNAELFNEHSYASMRILTKEFIAQLRGKERLELLIMAVAFKCDDIVEIFLPFPFNPLQTLSNSYMTENTFSALLNRKDKKSLNHYLPLFAARIGIPPLAEEKSLGLQQANMLIRYFLSPHKKTHRFAAEIIKNHVNFNLLHRLPRKELNDWLAAAIQHRELARLLAPQLTKLESIGLYDGGTSEHSWSYLAADVLEDAPLPTPEQTTSARIVELDKLIAKDCTQFSEEKLIATDLSNLIAADSKFLRIVGRTILCSSNNGKVFAIKIQKTNGRLQREDPNALIRECTTTNFYNKHKRELKLEGHIPQGIGVLPVTNVYSWLKTQKINAEEYKTFCELVGNNVQPMAYVYEADINYFTYLHDVTLTDSDLEPALRSIVNNVTRLLKKGVVHHALIDLYHNIEHKDDRTDGGRYMVFVDLLRTSGRRDANDHAGSGRLTHWLMGTLFPNFRASGLADLGDWRLLSDFCNDKIVQKEYSECYRARGKQAINYIKANLLGEAHYAIFLTLGHRCRKLTELYQQPNSGKNKKDIKKLWSNTANQVVMNCVQTMAMMTELPETVCHRFLMNLINIERLAYQMRYWMTNKYIPYALKQKLKSRVYGPDVRVHFTHPFRPGTFNLRTGFAIDGINADLGPVNGQEPIKEANKLFYWMTTATFACLKEKHNADTVLKNMMQEKTPDAARRKYYEFHSFLSQPKFERAAKAKMTDTEEENKEASTEFNLQRKRYAFYQLLDHAQRSKFKKSLEKKQESWLSGLFRR